VSGLYDRAKADSAAADELRRFRELETEEEAAFCALLATMPATKASAMLDAGDRRGLRLRQASPSAGCDGQNAGMARDDGGAAAERPRAHGAFPCDAKMSCRSGSFSAGVAFSPNSLASSVTSFVKAIRRPFGSEGKNRERLSARSAAAAR
jgi:hypothetical protein